MNTWLGADGKGMMDAFNPADHDIGVQVFGNSTDEDVRNAVLDFTDITDTYLLAMPGVAVNGIDYTVNAISEPNRFHILAGRSCIADNEIVVTEFVAADLGVSVGDTLTVIGDSGSNVYVISGIYSCANNMGANIGMSREGYLKIGKDDTQIWCHHYFLADETQKPAIIQALSTQFGGDVHIHENTWPGLFGIISAMQMLLAFMYSMVFIFILIVTVMTGSKILASEQRDIGIYKAIGFTTGRLRLSFAMRFGIVALIGSAIGVLLGLLLTDTLVSAVMKFAGISNFASSPNAYTILFPAVFAVMLTGCGQSNGGTSESPPPVSAPPSSDITSADVSSTEDENTNASSEDHVSATQLYVTFGDNGSPCIMHLYDNDTAAAIARHVGSADWRLPIYNYDGYDNWEVMQYYDIPSHYEIPSNPEGVTAENSGSVYYSEPNRIVLFYSDAEVSGEYTRVGYFESTDEFVNAVSDNPILEGWGNKIIQISANE